MEPKLWLVTGIHSAREPVKYQQALKFRSYWRNATLSSSTLMSQPATAPFVRVALITGAGQGIGRSIALRLCEDGLDIAVNDLPSSASQLDSLRSEIASSGRKCIVIPADISQEDQVKAMIDLVVLEMGHLDVVSV